MYDFEEAKLFYYLDEVKRIKKYYLILGFGLGFTVATLLFAGIGLWLD